MANNTSNNDEMARAQREQANADTLLLKPPAEVRKLIYYEVIIICDQNIRKGLNGSTSLFAPNISSVSRQLRKETLPIFYGESNFIVRPDDLYRGTPISWIKSLAADSFACLRKFSITAMVICHCGDETMMWSKGHPVRRSLNVTINRTNEDFKFSSTLEIEQVLMGTMVPLVGCLSAEATKNLAGAMLCCFRSYNWEREGREKMIELLEMLNDSQDL